jgi:ABC-type multidrug transport system ATPase subunit
MWYLDKVLPDPKKATLPPWFFVLPSFWGCSSSKNSPRGFHMDDTHRVGLPQDDDLRLEMVAASRGDSELAIQGLRKDYSSIPCLPGGKTALNNFYLSANRGTIVALLGHNGAGKTTLINILTGKVNPSSGEAYLFGYSVNTDMSTIQNSMGICPQFDVLWPDLTAREHMRIMSAIKPHSADDVSQILEQVKLDDVTSTSSQFSGGMKRRLQLAISILGNPSVIFLDEPTTGMDPVNRRRVWDLVRSLKQDKLIFLTTHAMEEA